MRISFDASPLEARPIPGLPSSCDCLIRATWPDGYVYVRFGARAELEDPMFRRELELRAQAVRDRQEAAA